MAADAAPTAAAALEKVERTSALVVSGGENAATGAVAEMRDTRMAVRSFIVLLRGKDCKILQDATLSAGRASSHVHGDVIVTIQSNHRLHILLHTAVAT